MTYTQEEWKPIVGYEGLYEISNAGRVKGIQPRYAKHRLRAQSIKKRYRVVALSKHGKVKHCLVHRLVMAAFVGGCPTGHEVNHKDGDTSNNSLGNLEYLTGSASPSCSNSTVG